MRTLSKLFGNLVFFKTILFKNKIRTLSQLKITGLCTTKIY